VIKLKEKRQVGSVYCITKIDKYGKCENGFVPAVDLPLGDNTLGQELAAARQEIAELKKELAETKKILAQYQEATKKSFEDVINEIEKEKFL